MSKKFLSLMLSIEPDELASELADMTGKDELIDLIMAIDAQVAETEFTQALIDELQGVLDEEVA